MLESRRILVPVDFSDSTGHTLAYAAEIARAFGARLEVLHVCALHEEGVAEASREMEGVVPEALADVVESCEIVRALSPDLGIIHAARERSAGLIVMGTHGRSGLGHVLLGSVAERVVQLAGCPVLTVRHPNHRFEHP
jgi:nucleotide-binding universal stress UspA family protein